MICPPKRCSTLSCEKTSETFTSSSTTCGTGMSAIPSTVRCLILSWETVFGTSTNCVTISGTGTSRILGYGLRQFRQLYRLLNFPDILWYMDVHDLFTDLFRNLLLRSTPWHVATRLRYHVGSIVSVRALFRRILSQRTRVGRIIMCA